jgi:hypothetical protein
MNTKMHSTSSEPKCLRVASYICISTVIRENFKMYCKKYLSGSKNEKNKLKQVLKAAENYPCN